MIIKPKGVAVDIAAGVSTVPQLDNYGATLVSLVNTNNTAVIVVLTQEGTNVAVAASERVVIKKEPATQLDATSASSPVWASAVGFTN